MAGIDEPPALCRAGGTFTRENVLHMGRGRITVNLLRHGKPRNGTCLGELTSAGKRLLLWRRKHPQASRLFKAGGVTSKRDCDGDSGCADSRFLKLGVDFLLLFLPSSGESWKKKHFGAPENFLLKHLSGFSQTVTISGRQQAAGAAADGP